MFIKLRGKKYYLRMHVPIRFAEVEKRKQIWIALGTDSEREAKGTHPLRAAAFLEDRLLAADVDHRIRCDLMGHAIDRQRYGLGASLEKAHGILAAIAL